MNRIWRLPLYNFTYVRLWKTCIIVTKSQSLFASGQEFNETNANWQKRNLQDEGNVPYPDYGNIYPTLWNTHNPAAVYLEWMRLSQGKWHCNKSGNFLFNHVGYFSISYLYVTSPISLWLDLLRIHALSTCVLEQWVSSFRWYATDRLVRGRESKCSGRNYIGTALSYKTWHGARRSRCYW